MNSVSPLRPRALQRGLVLLSSLLLCACSALEGDKVDYGAAVQNTPLAVPPDLTQLPQDTRYALPGSTVSASTYGSGMASSPQAPRAQTVAPNVPSLRLEGQGGMRWLVATGMTPEDVWPKLRSFWEETGLKLTLDEPKLGLMETEWAENRAKLPQNFMRKILGALMSTSTLDLYRTRVERVAGPNGGTSTEIYISHRGLEEVYTDDSGSNPEGKRQTAWQPRASDPEMEIEMLRRLMLKLGAPAEQADAQSDRQTAALNDPAQAPPKTAQLEQRNGQPLVTVREPFDRAWRRVGLTLDRTGFTVEDRDRSQGIYYVRYVQPPKSGEEEPGWWARTFGGAKPLDKTPRRYRITVRAEGNQSTVTVLNAEGAPERSEPARNILQVIADDLR
ncbi:outer membrane protein assembly factor BamC [Hylemonella gracilis]|uniref:NlpB/DapX family lipoprotein n=1 Tax=Hylemonella gracilis ATCC 19624 TaxID=887062 RepID=F3KNR8_9BURK|nr:outer membrane protein assembly factor BamC [Hylemonella gracilis]EGI78634.1 NlpB/DapX family lipoprotein [Hylemonella gracilis ATCC 19624]